MKKIMKGIPVYLMVFVLISGTALGASMWFLTVDVPIEEYQEPVSIEIEDEIKGDDDTYEEDHGSEDFRLRETHEYDYNANLTYHTYHHYVEIENPGDEPVDIQLELEAEGEDDDIEDWIGFVKLSGRVEPEEVDWDYEEDNGNYYRNETDDGVVQGYEDHPVEFEKGIGDDDDTQFTVITVLRQHDGTEEWDEEEGTLDEYEITWRFEDTTFEDEN